MFSFVETPIAKFGGNYKRQKFPQKLAENQQMLKPMVMSSLIFLGGGEGGENSLLRRLFFEGEIFKRNPNPCRPIYYPYTIQYGRHFILDSSKKNNQRHYDSKGNTQRALSERQKFLEALVSEIDYKILKIKWVPKDTLPESLIS